MRILLLLSAIFLLGRVNATTYYSQVTGSQNMAILSNWDSNPGGGGTDPSDFTTSGDVFVIQASHSIALTSALVLGSNVNLEIEGTLNPASSNLTVGGTTYISGSGSFDDNSTIGTNIFVGLVTLNTTGSWSSIGSTASLMQFNSGVTNSAGSFTCGAATFGASSTITPTSAMTFNGAIICSGDLTIANGALVSNTGGSSQISGNFTIGTGGFTKTAQFLTIGGTVTTTGPWNSTGVTGSVTFSNNITNNSSSDFACGTTIFNPSGTNINLSGSGSYSFSDAVQVNGGKTVTNLSTHSNGVTFTGTLNGQTSTSEWINGANSVLNYTTSSSTNAPMATGKLTASASGNWVNYNRSGNQNVKGSTYANLKISGGGIKSLSSGIANITESLDLVNGVLKSSGPSYPYLKNGATSNLGNANSFIEGIMRYDMAFNGSRTLNFALGKSSDWRPAVLNITHSSSTSYTYRAIVYNASAEALGYTLPSSVDKVSKAHYWDINRLLTSSGSKSQADISGNPVITLYYDANDNVQDPSNLTICKNEDSAPTDWFDIGGTGATITSGSVSSTSSPSAFSSFSRFTLGNKNGGNNPLPVKIVSFSGSCGTNATILEWTTATEINNDFFTVETSKDGNVWTSVKNIKGAGNSNQLVNYSCIIPGVVATTSFYRLKQTDFDGKFEYTQPISVKNCKTGPSTVTIYPNPSAGVVNINFNGEKETIQTIEVYNLMGSKIFNTIGFQGQIDLSNAPAGIYYAYLVGINETMVQKIVLEK